jgi:exoribonuclease-2
MLVELMEGGGPVCGWAIPDGQSGGTAAGRLSVRLEGGKTITVAPARLLSACEVPAPASEAQVGELLIRTSKRRASLAAEVDLAALWELLDGEGPLFGYDLLAGLSFGREVGPDEASAVMRAVHADGLWFEFSPGSTRRRDGGEIERLRLIIEREAAKKLFKERGARWLSEAAAGRAPEAPLEAPAVLASLKAYLLEGETSPEANRARELLKLSGAPATAYGALAALASLGEASMEDNYDLLRLGLPLEFPPPVLAEAAALSAGFDPEAGGRLDLTGLWTVTVDAPGAREFDDAVSLEILPDGSEALWLHIADAAALVPPGGPLDDFAAGRAATIYMPERRYPMMPEVLTEGLLSLKIGERRPAFSLRVALSADGEPLTSRFAPTVIRVDRQLSFPEADEILAGAGPMAGGDGARLAALERLSAVLAERRVRLGAQSLKIPKVPIRLDASGLPAAMAAETETRSVRMVEEMMILANHLAAKTLMEASRPCPYRHQDKNAPRLWNPPPDSPPRVLLAADLAARRLIGRAGVSLEPSIHHGVGLGVYTSFTSPMRRYLDLAVARELRALASGAGPVHGRQDLLGRTLSFDNDHRAIRRLQNSRQRYWLMRLLAGKVGETFTALVYDRRGRRARACVTDYMLDCEIGPIPADVEPGRDIRLRLAAAEPQVLDRPETLSFEYLGPL